MSEETVFHVTAFVRDGTVRASINRASRGEPFAVVEVGDRSSLSMHFNDSRQIADVMAALAWAAARLDEYHADPSLTACVTRAVGCDAAELSFESGNPVG